VDIRFESRGEEIKVKCIRRVLGKWRECSLHMERAIHLNNALLSISFVPVAYKGSITCVDPKVTFKTDLEIDSQLCQAFDGLCGAIEKTLETKLTPKVVSATLAAFNDRRLKKHVANAMMKVPGLRDHLDGRKVLEVESKGSRFVLTVEDQQRARTQLAQRARAQLAQRARTQLAQRARTQLAQRARTQLAQRARTQLTQRARAQLAQRAQRSDRRR
jgi:hypothetical protein